MPCAMTHFMSQSSLFFVVAVIAVDAAVVIPGFIIKNNVMPTCNHIHNIYLYTIAN